MIMIKTLYMLFWSLLIVFFVLSIWVAIPTSVILRPVAIKYEGPHVTLVRETPFGDVFADWTTEMRMAGRTPDCFHSQQTVFEVVENDTTRNILDKWAFNCLRAGPPLVIVDTWRAWAFGVIPLRPVRLVTVLNMPFDMGGE